jgi:hypothetical protein
MGSFQAGILKAAIAATATIFATAASAQVTYTDWFGGGVLTSATNCPTGNFDSHVNRVFTVRYLPAGIATNGTKSSISIINQHYAQGYALEGSFTTVLKLVSAQTIARFPGPSGYPVKVAITQQTPASISDTTPMINMTIKVIGFPGFPNNQNCTAIINATVFRP